MTGRYFLTKLQIEGFRGINNEGAPLELKFKSDSVNSLFAANGSGKSSIFEALSYAIRGTIPKLDALPAQDKPHSYINNRFHSKQTATIKLSFEEDIQGSTEVEITVVRDENGNRKVNSSNGLADPEAFLQTLDKDFALVDYQTFSRFMVDSPLNRGRSFSSLVGLAKYSNLRQMLQAASDTRSFNAEFGTKELSASLETLEKSVALELTSISGPFEALVGSMPPTSFRLTEIAQQAVGALSKIELIRPHVDSHSLHDISFDGIKDILVEAEGGQLRSELSELNRWLTAIKEIDAPNTGEVSGELKRLQDLVEDRDRMAKTTLGLLHRRLFSDAQDLLDSPEWEHDQTCPLCNSELDSSLAAAVKDQLAQLKHVIAKDAEIKNLYENSRTSARIRALESLYLIPRVAERQLDASVRSACRDGSFSIHLIERIAPHLEFLEKELTNTVTTKTARRTELESKLPPSMVQLMAQVDNGRQIQKSLKNIASSRERIRSLQARSDLYARWRSFLGEVNDTFASAESDMATFTLQSVEAEHKRLFDSIMRAGNIIPKLTRGTSRQDLHINLEDFHGLSGVSAQALLSESYSNALAISIFLAAAAQDNGSARFIVLDDITSSFDSGHQWQLMEQIRTTLQYVGSQNGIQFIILSHDGLLEKYFDTLGNNSNWHHQKLQGWPPTGAVSPTSQSADRLRASILSFLHAGQTDVAEPLIRQYLEFKLLRLITKLRIPVPIDFVIKDTQKMVANALEAILAAIDLHRKAGNLVLDATQVDDFEKIRVPAIIGNFTSHYATGSTTSFTPLLLIGVMSDIDALDECFKFDHSSNGQVQRSWCKSLTKQS